MRRIVLTLALAALPMGVSAQEATAGDAAAGQRVFNQCRACHSIDANGRNGVGPNLHGILGRRVAANEGYRYSPAMRAMGEAGDIWDEERLRTFLTNPRAAVPNTSMAFAGFRTPTLLNDVVAYLKQN